MRKTIGEEVIAFNKNLKFSDDLPEGFAVLNPFFDNFGMMEVIKKRYLHSRGMLSV